MFAEDVARNEDAISQMVRGSRVLVCGGAGSIGKEVAAQIFTRGPAALHVVDISENNLVELVRNLRSSLGYNGGETRFLPIDMGSVEMSAFLDSQPAYDYILNLAAMKHVRSEKDEFSLMRMIKVNILDTLGTLSYARRTEAKKYFAVSTDKAKNPANLMGATKRIMEEMLFRNHTGTAVSTARFANVAFSDGSLLHGFQQRLMLKQPISAPRDVRRYFVTGDEAGLLCVVALALGADGEIFFPNLDAGTQLLTFSDIARRFLEAQGYEPVEVGSEDEARVRVNEFVGRRKWPCYFFTSDTSGEKPFEEFYSEGDSVDWHRFGDIGVIRSLLTTASQEARIETFLDKIMHLREIRRWTKSDLVTCIKDACPELEHIDVGRFLDDKM